MLKLGEKADLLSDPLVKRSASWTMSTSQIYIRNAPAYGTFFIFLRLAPKLEDY